MTVKRMDNVGIVVEDIEAAIESSALAACSWRWSTTLAAST